MVTKPMKYPDDVRELVEKWRLRIIPEWEVVLLPHPATLIDDPDEDVSEIVGRDGYQGQSKTTHDYLVVRIWLNLEHHAAGECLEGTIIHELLHAALHDLETALDPVIYDAVSPQLVRLMKQEQLTALERTIERLSRVLVGEGMTHVAKEPK